jgi:hypothetical protein
MLAKVRAKKGEKKEVVAGGKRGLISGGKRATNFEGSAINSKRFLILKRVYC